MSSTLGPSPGAIKYPQHSIRFCPEQQSAMVQYNGQTLAKSAHAILLKEKGCEPVLYFPMKDVQTELLNQSESKSICPFKGEASYFTLAEQLKDEDSPTGDVAWYYPDVYDEVAQIAGHVAFYPEKVEILKEKDHAS